MKTPDSIPAAIDFYLRTRRQLGFAMENEAKVLLSLGQYVRQIHHRSPLSVELVLGWAQLPRQADPAWWSRRLAIARRFAQFWAAFDPRTQVPPSDFFGSCHRRPEVHIYTENEIAALLAATATLGAPDSLRAATFGALFGLLACTGLRISEALRLRPQDCDFARHTLLIQVSKSSPARLLPVQSSTSIALQRYDRLCRRILAVPARRPALFLNPSGRPVSRDCAERVFRKLRRQLAWTGLPLPRLHDLRHTFAVGWLIRWNRRPGRMDEKIPVLSAYLGHRHLTDTYWYLSAIPQLLALSNTRFEQLVRRTSKRSSHE